ncbi:DUF2470 domain-containing protein [Mangrovihabitans endophyticus]|uniref:DUF2470 domain-containing protein n=1 Tax=Mangrovihabitans endophyticus TaxID=1751298 RepID=A0A8J3BUT2_9ACTN|nr:DUF2470 domain-containing protein [Mangrovihabitans endophyticus]GGK70943.1 hypothetical protein GCM10012284_00930 [Mangrovihabitans endophyticus]
MQPTHAEVARTLAAGHLPATAQIACRAGRFPVRHVTDTHGRVLLLTPRDGTLAAALTPVDGSGDVALVLDIADVPPTTGGPSTGRVYLAGWAARLDGDQARAAALDYADVDAAPDLLDVGDTRLLHRMHVAEIRCDRDGETFPVDPDEYAAATPDPLRIVEFDLLADLVGHHRAELDAAVRRHLGPAARAAAGDIVPVRLDRYGVVLRLGERLARLAFARPVRDRHDLAHLLHPMLCPRCATD